ncbi:MAG: glycosyltransferase family 4 protein [Flavobacterium sp.]|nr:glycosyltransferase family 4 protein [Flavobacterium sp.]
MTKVILISQVPLPYSKIGSWTTLYKNYLEQKHHIDYIICEKPDFLFDGVQYEFVKANMITKVKKRILKNPYVAYLEALKKILEGNEKCVIQIIDNFGIVKPLLAFLNKNNLRDNCYLQFFYHGFPPFYENFHGRWFFESIDEMVLLTHDSYKAHRDYYSILPTRFSVLHNGIDISKFYPLSSSDKLKKREEKGIQDKKIFVWCAQDRPKKGLHIILDAWKRFYKQFSNTELWVIGCEPKQPIKGVLYYGRIPNDELSHYFQISDCYLFPTLCHEGFGLSLIEALHCGLYCIASHEGGVPEVLQYGKYGKLIEEPHFVTEWENAMVEFMKHPKQFDSISNHLYTTDSWNKGMNNIIMNAKISLT